ncbi:MAG TPA: DUF1116 domain-containing protein [Thermoanaerobaculia bacterium]|jgi:hypothetical protein|nr:DUF1116 domain-containing protein [Thermoanaerobaculia bacterium]
MTWGERIDAANAEAVRRMLATRPFWIDVQTVPGMGAREIYHSGPPVTIERMSGAQSGALLCAKRFEGWADSEPVELSPNHHHRGVGPMAGVVSPSMPVFILEDRTTRRRAYAALEEPRMNFGAFDAAAVELRRWWTAFLAPALGKAIRELGGLDLVPLIARALHRGDEMHNRPAAATSLMLVELAPLLPREAIEYIREDEIFFLSLSMGASKLMADAAFDGEDSTLVTAMARNGTDFGIRVAGTGDRWFTAPSPVAKGLMLAGFTPDDAGADMGDSAITETVGLGGFVLQGAPAINEMLGTTASEAWAMAEEMRRITVATHPSWTMPALDFAGAPLGIDVRKVVETGILPLIDTAIAHKRPGFPIIGAGLTRPPMACFTAALRAFAADRGIA